MSIERLDRAFEALNASDLSRNLISGMLGVEMYALACWFEGDYDLYNPLPYLDRIERLVWTISTIAKARGSHEVLIHLAPGSDLVTAIAAQNWSAVDRKLCLL